MTTRAARRNWQGAGAVALLAALAVACPGSGGIVAPGKTHTYYVAADEIQWDYAPDGTNVITGQPFEGMAKTFVEQTPQRIGKVYWKAVYREYTDDTFTTLKPRPAEWQHLGIVGPVLRGQVGDTIKVVFRNHASRAYGMHPHGVFYNKDSEGAPSNDGTSGADKADDAVPPGGTHTYTWQIPERAGPGPNDPSSLVWLYHSHTTEMLDVNAGMIGAIVVTRRGMAGPDGRPVDVDREFVSLFMIFDENISPYLDKNIDAFATDKKLNRLEDKPVDTEGMFSVIGTGFVEANFKATINGYLFGNGPLLTMKKGERVRWYVVTIGEGANFHTPHWHGNVVLDGGHRTDVIAISPAQMATVDMVPDDPGIWLYHCHVDDHMDSGMITRYQVLQ
ncbi:MAG TPA: multicopper oxidase domain-containing protein [Vicinamibacterales bacterium]|nr:multicopper oxidase domain-containing protein [Vicinamibacterales bacterium]